jgi:hypothetical protein
MNSRAFFTNVLFQTHKQVLEEFLIQPGDEIDVETADLIANNAGLLASRLTAEWERCMRWFQEMDNDPASEMGRENSITDLTAPFEPSSEVCSNCGGHIDHDDDLPKGITFPIASKNNQNLVQ